MKKILICAGIIAAVLALIIGVIFVVKDKDDTDNSEPIETVTKINLNEEQYINSLKKIDIAETGDTIIVTKEVKWEVPEHDSDTTVSFSIAIPYTITVDGNEYSGTYELGDSAWNKDDENPKYKVEVTNLTKNGEIGLLITER